MKLDGLVPGRHVFYESIDGTHAAIVSKVSDPSVGRVNLLVIGFIGETFGDIDVMPESDDAGRTPGRWRWMFESQPTALTKEHNL